MSCSLQVQLGFLLLCSIWRISSQCSTDQFACLDGSKCIPLLWLCDGARDCPDGSDEKHSKCHPHSNDIKCFGNQPECLHGGVGRCIPNEWLCDGHKDCDNGEDEANCNGNSRVTGADGCGPGQHSCEGKCISLNQRCEDLQTGAKIIYPTSTTKNISPTATTAENIIHSATTAKNIVSTASTAKGIISTKTTAGPFPAATTTKYTTQTAGKISTTTSTSKAAPSPSTTTSKTKPKSPMLKVEHSPNEPKESKSPQPIVPVISYAGHDRLPDTNLYNVKSLRINKTEIPYPTLMPEMTSPEQSERPTVTNSSAATPIDASSDSEQPKKFPASEEPVDVRRMPEKPNPFKRQADPSSVVNRTQEEIIYDLAEEKQPEFKLEKSEEAKKELSAIQEPIKPAPNPVRSNVVDPIKPVNA